MTSRFKLFLLWFCGFAVCFLVVLSFLVVGYTVQSAIGSNLLQITAIFAPYLTPIVAFWYVRDVKQHKLGHSRQAYLVAMICSSFYIVVMLVLLLSVFWQEPAADVIESTTKVMTDLAAYLAFLVGPAIGFFFAKTG